MFDEIHNMYDNVMTKCGYLNNGVISIPNRIESNYKLFSDSDSNINTDAENLPF